MAAPRKIIPKEIVLEALNKTKEAYGIWHREEAAKLLGVNTNTLRKLINEYEFVESKESINLDEFSTVNEINKKNLEIRSLKRQIQELTKEQFDAQDLKTIAFKLADETLVPPDWVLKFEDKADKGTEIPVLLTSDFQWGESVKPEEVDGINEYSVVIAKKRYRRLIERTIDLCMNHTKVPNYDGFYYLRGGDSISGAIHDELAYTDDLMPNPCIKSLAEVEIWGIEQLKQHFKKVHIISVPGNHGRTTKKPHQKQYSDLSNDDLLSWAIELYFSANKDKDITFSCPRSGDAYFNIGKTSFLLTHGDRIGSGGYGGFIGPAANIAKGIYKIRQQYHQIGQHIDFVLMGHFHTPMFLQHGLANGSLIGFNEFAGKKMRVEPEPPSQWLFHVHPRRGMTNLRKVYVNQ
jgi:hypothetical protein